LNDLVERLCSFVVTLQASQRGAKRNQIFDLDAFAERAGKPVHGMAAVVGSTANGPIRKKLSA
jgi:hypothetical protein